MRNATTMLAMAMALGGSSGCAPCDTEMSNQSVTGALAYTESTAMQAARAARIRRNGVGGAVQWQTDADFGEARVVDDRTAARLEAWRDDGRGQIVLSNASFDPQRRLLPALTVTFDAPAAAGTYDLGALHGRLCERATDLDDVCADVAGVVAYQPSGAANFDAGVTLDVGDVDADAPQVAGSLHVHYDRIVVHDTCASGGSGGLFGPGQL